MRMSAKIITALSVTGLAVAAGSAFTGAGLSTTAGESQFVGGTVSQTVTGATLTNIAYGFGTDTTKTAVSQVTLSFAPGADAKSVAVVLDGGGTATFTCEDIGATTPNEAVCDVTAGTGTSKTNVTNAEVTVTN